MSKEEFPKEEELNKEKSSTKKAKPSSKINEKKDHHKADTVEKLKNDLALSNKKSAEFEDKFLRDEAEIQNMQSRFTKERTQLIKYEAQGLAKDVLPAMDNLERALATEADDEVSKQLKKGVQMTLESLTKAMKDHGIVEIEAEDTKFDPTLHQAVQTVSAENDDQKDKVVKVLQKGYQYKDRTLRPAMVVVAQ